jgi:hypothetical protein
MKSISLLFIVCIVLSSCDDPVSSKDKPIPEAKTNPFVGTWVELFDTTADSKFSKEDKISYWYRGEMTGWIVPNTISFSNDSVMDSDGKYWYDSIKITITALNQHEAIEYDTTHLYYIFKSDSLYTNIDPSLFDSIYFPPYVKVE